MIRRRILLAGMVAALTLVAAACTGDGISIEIGPAANRIRGCTGPGPSRGITLEVNRSTPASQVRSRRCASSAWPRPRCPPTTTARPPRRPPTFARWSRRSSRCASSSSCDRSAVQPVSAEEIAGKLEGAFDDTYPREFYDRRTVAWQTLGVMPRDVTIRDALLAFQTGQVVGFYNPVDGELVYRADGDIGLVERVTLAHELTHAIDDQHFDLARIDGIAARCRDEAFQAALGAVEGSAQFFAMKVLFEFPPDDGDLSGLGDGGGLPEGVPPFIADLLLWPYTAGQAFVTALGSAGGVAEIDAALRTFPTTTEQILHPERYPTDRPTPVDVPELAGELGAAWGDLDAMQVGEAWLQAMLELRLDAAIAEAAAAGWDGGIYRAFTDGEDAVVVAARCGTRPPMPTRSSRRCASGSTRAARACGHRAAVSQHVTFAVSTTDEPIAAAHRSTFPAGRCVPRRPAVERRAGPVVLTPTSKASCRSTMPRAFADATEAQCGYHAWARARPGCELEPVFPVRRSGSSSIELPRRSSPRPPSSEPDLAEQVPVSSTVIVPGPRPSDGKTRARAHADDELRREVAREGEVPTRRRMDRLAARSRRCDPCIACRRHRDEFDHDGAVTAARSCPLVEPGAPLPAAPSLPGRRLAVPNRRAVPEACRDQVRLRLLRRQQGHEGPARRQGGQPRRDDEHGAAGPARVHDHDRGVPGATSPRAARRRR